MYLSILRMVFYNFIYSSIFILIYSSIYLSIFLGDDVCDWIAEKSAKLDMDDLAKDLTTVKALQRKHKGIERELAPIKDKVIYKSKAFYKPLFCY